MDNGYNNGNQQEGNENIPPHLQHFFDKKGELMREARKMRRICIVYRRERVGLIIMACMTLGLLSPLLILMMMRAKRSAARLAVINQELEQLGVSYKEEYMRTEAYNHTYSDYTPGPGDLGTSSFDSSWDNMDSYGGDFGGWDSYGGYEGGDYDGGGYDGGGYDGGGYDGGGGDGGGDGGGGD